MSYLIACNALAEPTGDCPAEGELPASDKEVVHDGVRMRFESGDILSPHSQTCPSPVGRLRARKSFWLFAMHRTNTICSTTLSIINSGYRLPWNNRGPAPPVLQPNHQSTLDEVDFVTEAVTKGESLGTWKRTDKSTLRCIMPLGVATHNRTGKKRLIFDCRHLNQHLEATKFKMEGLHWEGRALFRKGWFGGTIDLTSAYYHVEMHPDAHPYLGFEWKGTYYYYTVLPFGISTAPYIFTQVMKTTVAYLRSGGALFIQYLDDLPFTAPTAEAAMRQGRNMIQILRSFGWLVHLEKCVGIESPTQSWEALGSVIDLGAGLYRTPPLRMNIALSLAESILQSPTSLPVKIVAKAKGLFGSMWLGIGEHARIRTRALGKVIDSRLRPEDDPTSKSTWRRKVALSESACAELRWWITNLAEMDGRPIKADVLEGTFDGTIATDASDTGYGGWVSLERHTSDLPLPVLAENLLKQAGPGFSIRAAVRSATSGIEVWGRLPPSMLEERASSTLREIFGAFSLLSLLSSLLIGGRFRLHFDNICCVMGLGGKVPPSATGGQEPKSVLGGSRVDAIQEYLVKILDLAMERKITLVAIWVPRAANERSDLLSRMSAMARAEYWMTDSTFSSLDERWGPHTLDVFSIQETVRVRSGRFMSKFYHQNAIWIDCLSTTWPSNDVIWAHPPPRLVGEAVQQFQESRSRGTLIIPLWRSTSWWPLIYPRGDTHSPATFIKSVVRLGPASEVMSGITPHPRSNFGSSIILALRIDCRGPAPRPGGPAGAGSA